MQTNTSQRKMKKLWKYSSTLSKLLNNCRGEAKPRPFLVFNFVVFLLCFRSRFSTSFGYSFCRVLDRFWTPCWAYVGSFFELFSLLRWGPILKSFWHRFSSILEVPGTKIELPPTRESNFTLFTCLILRSFLSSILEPNRLPKSSPRGSKIPSETSLKFERS